MIFVVKYPVIIIEEIEMYFRIQMAFPSSNKKKLGFVMSAVAFGLLKLRQAEEIVPMQLFYRVFVVMLAEKME